MTEAIERVKAAFSDRYGIESEIGQGGMATIYLAEDLKHDREPEVAAERFVQEMKTTDAATMPGMSSC